MRHRRRPAIALGAALALVQPGCGAGEGGGGEVDAGLMEQICAVSLLLDDPDMVECLVYL